MSLSNPQVGENPASKFIEWKAKDGYFGYWDKNAPNQSGGTGEIVKMPEAFYIIVLDQLNCITGFHKNEKLGFYSNEVRNMNDEQFIVKYGRGNPFQRGLYADIKVHLEAKGAKFCKSVYAVWIKLQGKEAPVELELICLKFWGAAFGAWLEAGINDGTQNVITLSKNPEMQQTGDNVYYIPRVTVGVVREDILKKAIDIDKELQVFLDQRSSRHAMQSAGQNALDQSSQQSAEQNWVEDLPPPAEEQDQFDDLPF